MKEISDWQDFSGPKAKCPFSHGVMLKHSCWYLKGGVKVPKTTPCKLGWHDLQVDL